MSHDFGGTAYADGIWRKAPRYEGASTHDATSPQSNGPDDRRAKSDQVIAFHNNCRSWRSRGEKDCRRRVVEGVIVPNYAHVTGDQNVVSDDEVLFYVKFAPD